MTQNVPSICHGHVLLSCHNFLTYHLVTDSVVSVTKYDLKRAKLFTYCDTNYTITTRTHKEQYNLM